ncbi:MAG: LPS-assembly protein LptD [Armatimonadota bacterium]|nr:MAG: LPS-assembly protein LptD [Armatimonadota bacterium]
MSTGSCTGRRMAALLMVMLVGAAGAGWSQDQPADYIELRSADHIRYDDARRVVYARGNVRFGYEDVEVSADELTADLRADTAVLAGGVVLRTQGEQFRGDTLLVHLDTREWEFTDARSAISPRYFESGVLSPLYVGARDVRGFKDRLAVKGADFTTCDLPHPHYEITARSLRIWPGRKLIADHAGFWVLGERIFTLPWFLVPLREPGRQPLVPLAGQDAFQGYYLKTIINYVRSDDSYGSGHLDLMSRRGVGTGIEHTEVHPRGRSDLYLYQVNNTNTNATEWTARGTHQQDLGDGLSLRASADVRSQNYYYVAGTRVANSQLALNQQRGGSHSSLAFDYNNTSGSFDFTRFSTSLRHNQRGPRYGLSLDSRYDSQTTFADEADDLELNNRVEVTDRQTSMDARLVVSKRFDLDDDDYTGDDFYQVVDRLPELLLETDTYRLRAAPGGIPARMTLSVGNFSERPTDLDAYRVYYDYRAIPDTIRLGPATRVNATGRFQQYLYGDRDRTAQYAYGGNLRLEQDLGDEWQARLGYVLLEPKGYTPFRFDYIGNYRSATFDLNYRRGTRYRARLRTGYDARFSRWQNVIARAELPLHRNLQLGVSAGYDPNRGMPRDLLTQLRFGDYRTALEVSALYQPDSGKLLRATGYLDWVANPKWRVQLLSSYDGLQDKFVYGEVLVTRDMHCWEAMAYYSLQRDLFRLDFRIKAFDWGRPDFGVGRSGQYLDTSLGEWH